MTLRLVVELEMSRCSEKRLRGVGPCQPTPAGD